MRRTSLSRAVGRLERDLGLRGPCSECRGAGRIVVAYEGAPEEPAGCPACGRRLLIRVVYDDVPLPA